MAGKINNFFWLSFTYLAAPLFYFLIFLKNRRKDPSKILIIQTAKIGDLVCTTPVFRGIKEKYPDCHLTLLAASQSAGIARNNPRVDKILPINDYQGIAGRFKLIQKLRKENYDWIFNLSPDSFNNTIAFWALVPNRVSTIFRDAGITAHLGSFHNNYRLEFGQHTSLLEHYLALLRFLGIEAKPEDKEIFIKADEEAKAAGFLDNHNLKKDNLLVGISCTSNLAFRQWELEKFARLADLLAERSGAKIIFTGAAGDSSKNERVRGMMRSYSVNAAGVFQLYELPALLKNLKLFIAMDTGPLYMANALGVPVVDIAGPDDMREQSPLGSNVRLVQKNLYCIPCSFVLSGVRYCKEGHLRCVKEISPEEVFFACQSLLLNR